MNSTGNRRADLLGYLEMLAGTVWWNPITHSRDGDVFYDHRQPLDDGIRIKCRHGHDLRAKPERIDRLSMTPDRTIFLPG